MGENKVCPARKSITVPRTELLAAVLGVRIYKFVEEELSLLIKSVHYWVDSISTLRYIKNTCRIFQVYIANWVSEIQSQTNIDDWDHVNTQDLASREVLLKMDPMNNKRVKTWFHGPEFLLKPPSEWPNAKGPIDVGEVEPNDPELRSASFATFMVKEDSPLSTLLIKSPNMHTMKLRVAYLKLFCKYVKNKKDEFHRPKCQDLADAEKDIMKIIQRQKFSKEIETLAKNKTLPKSSRLETVACS